MASVEKCARSAFANEICTSGSCSASVGLAETGAALVADDAAGKAHQDRSQGNTALEVRDLPTGRGGGDKELVRRDPRPHCAAGATAAAGHVT